MFESDFLATLQDFMGGIDPGNVLNELQTFTHVESANCPFNTGHHCRTHAQFINPKSDQKRS